MNNLALAPALLQLTGFIAPGSPTLQVNTYMQGQLLHCKFDTTCNEKTPETNFYSILKNHPFKLIAKS